MKKIAWFTLFSLALSSDGLVKNNPLAALAADQFAGLYETPYAPDEASLPANGLLESFESKQSFAYETSFAFFYQNGIAYTASINSDVSYVSEGASSLKLDYSLVSYEDPYAYPSIFFAVPTPNHDFSTKMLLAFDYWNLSALDLGYYVWAAGEFVGGGYTYKYSADNANPKGDLLFLSHDGAKHHTEIVLEVDFGKYNDGETSGGADIPQLVQYLRLPFVTTGSGEASLYLDNVVIQKIV